MKVHFLTEDGSHLATTEMPEHNILPRHYFPVHESIPVPEVWTEAMEKETPPILHMKMRVFEAVPIRRGGKSLFYLYVQVPQ